MGSTSSKKPKGKQKKKSYINWFEIPALNLPRAVTFYSRIFDIEMESTEMNGYAMAFFPSSNGVGGALVSGQGCSPGETGALLYLNGGDDLNAVLERIEGAGGRVVMGKTLISEDIGYFAIFIDTEGNKLALHSAG